MKLELDDAKAILALEDSDAGLPIRGVHIRRDGTPGMAPGARYVDLEAPADPITGDRAGWSMRVRDVSDELPRELVAEKCPKVKDPACKKRIEDALKATPLGAEKVESIPEIRKT